MVVLKLLSDTIWSCYAESCQVIINNYKEVIKTLKSIISQDSTVNGDIKWEDYY